MADKAILQFDNKSYELPVVVGTEAEKAIDITKLRGDTGLVTLDDGYMNTGGCSSAITFIDGEKGILRYRGIPIEQLAEKSDFVETSYLLIYGRLPTAKELAAFRTSLTRHSMIHEDMRRFFDGYPSTTHPMAVLSSMVCSLSAYYPEEIDLKNKEHLDLTIVRILSKVRTIAAFSYKKSIGQPIIYPKNSLDYVSNFLHTMFAVPAEDYHIDPDFVKALNVLLILHADHEQNCSTSTVRLVGSSKANLFAALSAGICALWGPLHGGANQEVIEMLTAIRQDGGDVKKYVELAKKKDSGKRLMGFGHRVYKNYDPRASIIKTWCHKVIQKVGNDQMLDIALSLEEIALKDEYFVERKLYPNVDFYSGIIYRAMGIPTNMFTVMFALGRLPGWIAHWKEMSEAPGTKIGRPRQIYTGATKTDYTPMDKRG